MNTELNLNLSEERDVIGKEMLWSDIVKMFPHKCVFYKNGKWGHVGLISCEIVAILDEDKIDQGAYLVARGDGTWCDYTTPDKEVTIV